MPHRLNTIASDGLAERGVYLHPYAGTNGERFVVGINHAGNRVLEATLPGGGAEVDAVVLLIWSLLDEIDPVTRLTLLR